MVFLSLGGTLTFFGSLRGIYRSCHDRSHRSYHDPSHDRSTIDHIDRTTFHHIDCITIDHIYHTTTDYLDRTTIDYTWSYDLCDGSWYDHVWSIVVRSKWLIVVQSCDRSWYGQCDLDRGIIHVINHGMINVMVCDTIYVIDRGTIMWSVVIWFMWSIMIRSMWWFVVRSMWLVVVQSML
jgi:hypothetical protein